MSRRHIALLVRWPAGGIRTYLKYVYPHVIRDTGWRATLVLPDGDESDVLREDLDYLGVRSVMVNARRAPFELARALVRLFDQEHVDVLHSHGVTAATVATPIAKVWRVPHLVTLHEPFQGRQFAGVGGGLKKWLIGKALSELSAVQTVSRDAQDNLVATWPRLRCVSDRIVTIPNGIASGLYAQPAVRNVRAELGIGPDVFLVGFLGRFMAPKGFRDLVEAMAILEERPALSRNVAVVAVGGGGFIREDTAMIRAKGLERRFHFLPFVPEVAGTLKAFDVVAMPSLWEAAGILAMETTAAGVPLIGTSCLGLREVLTDTPATVVPPGEPQELANAIAMHVINHEGKRREARAFALIAQRRFDAANTAHRLAELLGRVAGATPEVG